MTHGRMHSVFDMADVWRDPFFTVRPGDLYTDRQRCRLLLVTHVSYGARAYDSRQVRVKWLSYSPDWDKHRESAAGLEHVEAVVMGGGWVLLSRGPALEEHMR